MATTTTNYGWDIPQSTDLVKDGATAIAALGQDIDTALVDLKGGTTGQVLAKASNTDLDFSWVAQDDSNAIQNAIVDAKGDLISATAADTPARLAVGTDGQVLTADSTTATGLKWASVSSKFIQSVTTQTGAVATGTGVIPTDDTIPQSTEGDQYMSVTITPTSASSKLFIEVVANATYDGIRSITSALFVDSDANAIAVGNGVNRSSGDNLLQSFNHTMDAGSTSARTFKLRIGPDAGGGTLTFNGSGGARRFGGVFASSITVTEYTP